MWFSNICVKPFKTTIYIPTCYYSRPDRGKPNSAIKTSPQAFLLLGDVKLIAYRTEVSKHCAHKYYGCLLFLMVLCKIHRTANKPDNFHSLIVYSMYVTTRVPRARAQCFSISVYHYLFIVDHSDLFSPPPSLPRPFTQCTRPCNASLSSNNNIIGGEI